MANRSLEEVVRDVVDAGDTDVIMYNADIKRHHCESLATEVCGRIRRENCLLLLTTHGGDPHAAYRLARCLQRSYKKVSVYVAGVCKSAGTIVAIGAHELVMSDFGELGPLDIQMGKKDHLWEMQSGLTVNTALTTIQDQAFLAFEHFFLGLERRSQGQITVHTAAETAVRLATGIYAKLTEQIDPMHLGEARRAMQITSKYGTRLDEHSGNMKPEAIERLVEDYPDHSFVIDREEAEELFKAVRCPTPAENALEEWLGGFARRASLESKPIVEYLSDEPAAPAADEPNGVSDGEDGSPAGATDGAEGDAGQPSPSTGSD